jgi:hypothetical protein
MRPKQNQVTHGLLLPEGRVPEQFPLGILPTKEQLLDAAGNHPLYIQKLYSSVFISPKGFELLGLTTNSELLSRLKEEQDRSEAIQLVGGMVMHAQLVMYLIIYLVRQTKNK